MDTENKTKKEEKETEIDLLELGQKSIKGLSTFINYIINLIITIITKISYFFLRNLLAFFIIFALGIGAGFSTYNLKKQYYHSEMIAFSSIAANSEIVKSVNNWNYAREFSKEDAEKIKNVTSSFLIDYNGDGHWDIIEDIRTVDKLDTTLGTRVNGGFAVMIDVYDTSMVMPVKEKLMKFLFANEKVQRRNKQRLLKKDRLQSKIAEQLYLLDSLQKYEYYKEDEPIIASTPGDNMLVLQKKEKRLYHSSILDLYAQEVELKRQIVANPDPYDVRVDFEIPRTGSVTIIREILVDEIIFLILGIIIVFLRERRNDIKYNIRKAKEEEI